MYWTRNSMKNLSSYCGLVDAKIRASDRDLPVSIFFSDWSKLKRFLDPLRGEDWQLQRQKKTPFLIKSKTVCGHLIRVHFFIDHGGYSIGAIAPYIMGNSVRKLHFCSMCSKETQMKRIFYYGKQTLGPNQIYLESHQNFTKYFFMNSILQEVGSF